MQTSLESKNFSTESLEALYGIAYELYRNGKYQEAQDVFRFLTLANSFERKYWIGLAACHQMQKHYTDAIECYSIAAIQDPSDPYAHLHAAECFFHLGNHAKALEALESAKITAKDTPLMPKLEFLSDIWSKMASGGIHD
jgi:type III secretion system low calcium response chaperone LcrH/SycD